MFENFYLKHNWKVNIKTQTVAGDDLLEIIDALIDSSIQAKSILLKNSVITFNLYKFNTIFKLML